MAKAGVKPRVKKELNAISAMGSVDREDDSSAMVYFRKYQRSIFNDKTTKIVILEWSRQIGKSFTLANWAVDRLVSQLAKAKIRSWLIVVISNSRANGAEFGIKVNEASGIFQQAADEVARKNGADAADLNEFGLEMEDCQFKLEVRLKINGVTKIGRILVLSASPRTARGFSGDLILDEFAYHENAKAMWGAAEPIISSNPDFLCRIASTHNGPSSLFNKWIKTGMYPVNSMPRSKAWAMSKDDKVAPMSIISLRTGKHITPEEAREEASDQNEYDQNYENIASSESGSLLSWDVIHGASIAPNYKEDSQRWSAETIERLRKITRPMFAGMDVGRHKDMTVVTVLEQLPNSLLQMVATLTMKTTDSYSQRKEMEWLFQNVPYLSRLYVDFTGLGTGLVDEMIRGPIGYRCTGINFATYVPIPAGLAADGRREERVPVTEVMAWSLANSLRDRELTIPPHNSLQNSLHLPEKVSNAEGTRVRMAASRTKDESGNFDHADRFWSLALALYSVKDGKFGAFTKEDVDSVVACDLMFANDIITFPSSGTRYTNFA